MKFLLGLLISLFCIPLSFSNEYVILSSTSPEIKDGQVFTKEEKIKLLKGEKLEIMDESGNMFKIKGPYSYKIKHQKIKKLICSSIYVSRCRLNSNRIPEPYHRLILTWKVGSRGAS